MAREDVILEIGADGSEAKQEFSEVFGALINDVGSINSQLASRIGGEIVKKLVVQVDPDTGGFKVIERASSATAERIQKEFNKVKLDPGSIGGLKEQLRDAKQLRDGIKVLGDTASKSFLGQVTGIRAVTPEYKKATAAV